jgi:hypothetical protein
MAGKYDHINFKPPESVARAAERGLELRRQQPKSGKAGLDVKEAARQGIGSGVQRASDLKNRAMMSPQTIRRIRNYFSRHAKDYKLDPGKSPREDKGYVAGLLWGGEAGKSWANKVVNQMDAADRRGKLRNMIRARKG